MYIQSEDRDQLTLTPVCLDDYIGKDHICRLIEAYVESLDLAGLGFKYAGTKETGRPPYDPAKMLMLYIYGYLNRVRSSRRLEAETVRNVEVMWLMGKLTPDDRTICNFRKDNAKALKNVFREFSLWCARNGLYGGEAAVDGSKFRACNSRKNIFVRKNVKEDLAETEKRLSAETERYIEELDKNDAAE